jgi:hypothetical protein
VTPSLMCLSPWLCPASAQGYLKARVSKPALNARQGRQNALWRGERQALETGVSMQCNGRCAQQAQTVLESWVLVSVRDRFCAQNAYS